MVFTLNSTVCIAPEALPALNLPSFEYATVVKIDEDRGRVTLSCVGSGGTWRQKTIHWDLDGIVVVPDTEPTLSRLHANLRARVVFLEDGIIQLGQIISVQAGPDDNDNHLVEIHAGTGKRWIPLQDTLHVSDVGYALMHEQQVEAAEHVNLAYVQGVCRQLEDAVLAGSRTVSELMAPILSEEPVNPLLPIPIVHPQLGDPRETTPQHVVDWTFASRRSNQLPPDVQVGSSIWDDPRHPVDESDDSNDDTGPVAAPPLPLRSLTTRSIKRAASPSAPPASSSRHLIPESFYSTIKPFVAAPYRFWAGNSFSSQLLLSRATSTFLSCWGN